MTDCEERDSWFLAQDVNAWTSLAYVAVGAAVVAVVVRRQLPRHYFALGAAAVLAGAGSVGYHASPGRATQLVHDAGLLAMLGFLAGWHVGRCVDRPATSAVAGVGGGVVAGAVLWIVAPGATSAVTAVLVGVVVAAEVIARRGGRAPIWNPPLLVLVAVAAAAWWAGTPRSPFCAPASWLQPHGVWHALTAVVMLAWFVRVVDAGEPP